MNYFKKNPNLYRLGVGGWGAAGGGIVNVCEQMFRLALLLFKENNCALLF